jgi:hypothetical protein
MHQIQRAQISARQQQKGRAFRDRQQTRQSDLQVPCTTPLRVLMTRVARMFHVLCSPLSLPAGAIDGSDQAARSNGICLVLICLEGECKRLRHGPEPDGPATSCLLLFLLSKPENSSYPLRRRWIRLILRLAIVATRLPAFGRAERAPSAR